MQWSAADEGQRITRAASRLTEGECLVTWHWPRDVHYVYIYSFGADEEVPVDQLGCGELKLFTREEYKVKGGYRVPGDWIGTRGFRIYPCLLREGGLTALRQEDGDNETRVSGGRAKIRYSIRYGRSLFSRYRPVRVRLFCEMPVPAEALCYVKKDGAMPVSREDGMIYPFVSDLPAGVTELPEIEVGRSEQIRLFLRDGRMYGERFELLPEA